jgi:hypothetical protein
MSEEAINELLGKAAFAFEGSVEEPGAARLEPAAPVDDRTVVVHIDRVLHAPDAFAHLEGSRVTLRRSEDGAPLRPGDSAVFFANGLAFGSSVALQEVGRLPVDEVAPHETTGMAMGAVQPLHLLHTNAVMARLREHADAADAVVLGRVTSLARAVGAPVREHDPDWWLAVVHVAHAERGADGVDDLKVLYPNSRDVAWRDVPKPTPAQNALWILHATGADQRDLAPFRLQDAEDLQPPQMLDALRENG